MTKKLKKQLKDQSREIKELKNQASDIPPLRPKLEIAAQELKVDLTIDSTEDENENLKSKIEIVEGRDSRPLKCRRSHQTTYVW